MNEMTFLSQMCSWNFLFHLIRNAQTPVIFTLKKLKYLLPFSLTFTTHILFHMFRCAFSLCSNGAFLIFVTH